MMEQIQSSILPPEAVDYLNNLDKQKEDKKQREEMAVMISSAKDELLEFCNNFIDKSKAWRTSSYEQKWLKYQRAADGIYEPELAQAKKQWQSKVHVGITASHRESIHSYLFKVMAGTNPPLEISSRFDLGEQDQSANIQDIILRELDKARWEVEFDGAMHDADTYGSGFLRRFWKTETAIRKLKKPIKESFSDNLNPMGMVGFARRAMTGKLKTISYEESETEVITYRGLKVQHISIWDVFKTPKSIKIPGTTIGIRYAITYGDIVKGAKEGYYLSDSVEKLKSLDNENISNEGKRDIEIDRGVQDNSIPTTDYSKELECYELFGKLPKKWITAITDGVIDGDPEELISSRVIFHKSSLVAVEVNDEYDGEPPIHQLNYFPKTGDSYGRGVPEMLEDSQAVINEIVNQRLDNGAQSLNHHFAVIQKALVDAKDLESSAGMVLRLDSKYVPNGNAANAITQLPISDTPLRAGFSEVNEWERFAQERTSANRVTLGTAGLVKDSNGTLGGQQMLRESAGEKFAYIGLMMELSCMQDFFHGIWKTVYKNIDPTDIEDAIGPERAQKFIMITPEEIMRDYIYKPLGVFTMENKSIRQSRLSAIRQQFIGAPWIDDEKFFDAICRTADEDADMFKKDEQQILQEQAGMIQPGMGMEGQPEAGMPPVDTTGAPMPEQMPVPQ